MLRKESVKAEIVDAARKIRSLGNVYEVIGQFAEICSRCKELTGRPYDAGDYALLQIVQDAENTRLEMACWARGLGEALPMKAKWLTAPDARNEIRYTAAHLTGYIMEKELSGAPSAQNAVFSAYKKGNNHAVGVAQQAQVLYGKHMLVMLIHFH